MIKFKSTPETYTLVFLCMLWGKKLMSYITAVCLRLPGLNLLAWGVVPFILFIVFLLASKDFLRRIKSADAIFYFVCVSVFFMTYAFFPENGEYLIENSSYLISALPFVFVGRAIDIEKLAKPFYIISLLCITFESVNILVFETSERIMEVEYQYDMYSAYRLLPHVLMVLWHFMRKINIIDLAVLLLGLFVMLGYGTRGPLLCIVVFVSLYLLFGIEGRKKWWYYLLVVAAVFVAINSLNYLLEKLGVGIQQVGLSTRILDVYEMDMLDYDSGRERIHNHILTALSTSPVLGLGICGDRAVTGGTYCHNIIYEFLSSFGYLLGPVLLLALVILIIKAFRNCSSSEEKGFLLLLFGEVFHLLVSDTFLRDSYFFLLIGFSAKLIYDGRVRNEKIRTGNMKSNNISKVLS